MSWQSNPTACLACLACLANEVWPCKLGLRALKLQNFIVHSLIITKCFHEARCYKRALCCECVLICACAATNPTVKLAKRSSAGSGVLLQDWHGSCNVQTPGRLRRLCQLCVSLFSTYRPTSLLKRYDALASREFCYLRSMECGFTWHWLLEAFFKTV